MIDTTICGSDFSGIHDMIATMKLTFEEILCSADIEQTEPTEDSFILTPDVLKKWIISRLSNMFHQLT